MKYLACIFCLLIAHSSAVTASDNQRYYIGAIAGYSTSDISLSNFPDLDDGSINSDVSTDDNDYSFGIYFGFKVKPHLALEYAYRDFGKFNISGISNGSARWFPGRVEATADAIGHLLGLKGVYSLSESTELFARAGVNSWDMEYHVNDNGAQIPDKNKDGRNGYFGLGASLLYSRYGFSAEYFRTDIDDKSFDVFSLGIDLYFSVQDLN